MGHHELIIIGVTADIYAHQSRESLLKLGMDAVLIKPISLEVLERNIFNLLGEKAITKKVNNFCFDNDVRILILEEVLKVQYEVLHLIESNVCLLDERELNSLLHKVKGGALLSQAENLHQCCSELEQSNQVNSERIALFREALLINNADLESQLHQLKLL